MAQMHLAEICFPPECTSLSTHLFIISPRWHRKDDTLIDRNECSMCRNTRATWADTYDILDRVGWPRQMEMAYNWHLMKRIVTLFLLVSVFVSFVAVSLIYCWPCAMEYAPRARLQHLYYFTKTGTHSRQLKYFVWFVACAFFRHTCVTRGVAVTVNLFVRKTSSVWKRQLVSRPETIFKKHLMKRRRRRQRRRTEDTSSLKLLFSPPFSFSSFFSPTFESNKSIKKLQTYYFFGRLVSRVTFFPSELFHLMISLRLHFPCGVRVFDCPGGFPSAAENKGTTNHPEWWKFPVLLMADVYRINARQTKHTSCDGRFASANVRFTSHRRV